MTNFAKIFGVDDDSDASSNGNGSPGGNHLEHLADLVCQAHPNVDRASALRWLLRSKSGQALFARTMKRKDAKPMMETFNKVADIPKVCKGIADQGSTSLSEADMTAIIAVYAKSIHPDLPSDTAFAKIFTAGDDAGLAFRKAVQIAKGMPMMVVVPSSDKAIADPVDALAQLNDLATERRKREPALTPEQAFAKVYGDNPHLAAAERRQARARLGIGA